MVCYIAKPLFMGLVCLTIGALVLVGDTVVEGHTSMVNRSCPISGRFSKRLCPVVCKRGEACKIRAAVILPDNASSFESSLPQVMPALHIARDHVLATGMLPPNFNMTFTMKDDRCHAQYSSVLAVDAYARECVHVFFGPACEYSLAAVARMIKFWGTPLLSAGGLTFDYVRDKTLCESEFHMLVRVGVLSFTSMAEFIVALMRDYEWKKVMLVYEKHGYSKVAGENTCQLFMLSLVEELKNKSILYGSYDTDKYSQETLKDNLKREMQYSYSSMKMIGHENLDNNLESPGML